MTVDQVPVLIDRFGFKQERAGLDEMFLIATAGGKDDVPGIVNDADLDPALNQIERSGGKVVPDFVGGQNHANRNSLARRCVRRRLDTHADHRAFRPLLTDFGDGNLSSQPLLGKLDLAVGSFQVQHSGHHVVGGEKAMAAVLAVARIAIIVGRISGCRIVRIHQRHVALAALHRAGRVALVIPVAGLPVVVLILELHPADAVDLLVDKLFVAGRAVFGPCRSIWFGSGCQ